MISGITSVAAKHGVPVIAIAGIVDMSEKEISKGEFRSVCQAVGGINVMINEDCKDKDALALVKYISEEQKEEKLLANQQVIKTPIVRNGKQATVGCAPEIWKGWS